MKIFTIDIGKGTQDIIIYDDKAELENSIKMIFPSPSSILAGKVQMTNDDITFYGETMGGAPLKRSIKKHLQGGYKVYMTEKSAISIKDDMESVRKMGVTIIGDQNQGKGVRIETKDIDMAFFEGILYSLGMSLEDIDAYGISIQDHGFSTQKSNRAFRFEVYKQIIEDNSFMVDNLYFKAKDIPSHFTRMRSALSSMKSKIPSSKLDNTVFMDTSFAAVYGAYLYARDTRLGDKILALNIGNAHTLAATIAHNKICGLFEHHTRMLNRSKIELLLKKLIDGTLTNEEVFEDDGHGALVREPMGPDVIVVTGPKRTLIEETKLKFTYIYPCGDVLTPSNYALIKMLRR